MTNSLRLQHAKLPCPSLSPGVCSNSCPLSRWCHPTISFSVTPFSSCPQSIPASGSFLMSWLFASSGFSIKLQLQHHPSNEYSELISFKKSGLISLLSKGLSRVFSRTTVQKLLNVVQLSHPYMTTGKTIALTRQTFVGKIELGRFGWRDIKVQNRRCSWAGQDRILRMGSRLGKPEGEVGRARR